jgi:hypothetical protein
MRHRFPGRRRPGRCRLKLLTDWIARHQQRVLLLIDSTDLLLAGLAGGGSLRSDRKGVSIRDAGATPLWRLRKTLSHEKGIFWLAPATRPSKPSTNTRMPFTTSFSSSSCALFRWPTCVRPCWPWPAASA